MFLNMETNRKTAIKIVKISSESFSILKILCKDKKGARKR